MGIAPFLISLRLGATQGLKRLANGRIDDAVVGEVLHHKTLLRYPVAIYGNKPKLAGPASQTSYHMKVFLSRDPLGIVGAKPKALI